MSLQQPESYCILSPAKDLNVARAAIHAGADAIYIGGPAFGAREKAGNSIEDLTTLCREARTYGVHILITLNTLLSAEEREQAIQIAQQLWQAGVYAFIVQDLTLAEALIALGTRVHASTQCDNRTIEDVRARRDMGFSRVVLARELSINEIRAIHDAVPDIELEAFIHGALCVSYSGRCYMSEVLMGRSANRGACAQMCRMRYDLLDASGREVLDDKGQPIHQRYLLSLQDMDRSLYLSELIDAGITTFKIEGRLKDADYVTNITAYYRQTLDGILSQRFPNQKPEMLHTSIPSTYRYDFEPNPAKTFHRGGIDYFLHGRAAHMANHFTPKSTGEYIGTVLTSHLDVDLLPHVELHNGDGISIGDQGFSVNGFDGTRITPSSRIAVRPGDKLYRNLDVEFSRHLHAERRIPVTLILEEEESGYRLTMRTPAESRSLSFTAEHIPANNAEKAQATAQTQLAKLGDTPYMATQIQILTSNFIPAGALNSWRRQLTL